MEGANRGPYAKVIKLKNGHYKRVVDLVVPEIFIKLRACCDVDVTPEDFDFLTKGSQESQEMNIGEIEQERYDEEAKGRQLSGINEKGNYAGREDQGSESTENLTDTENSEEEDQSSVENEPKKGTNQSEPIVIRGNTKDERAVSQMSNGGMDLGESGIHYDEGVPVLFYTKMREKPALLSLTIDKNTHVIYMKKNKISRFFPIKLIQKFVTSPEVIMEEFSKQIKGDPRTKINNMVLFKAANFTDSVAVQFAEESAKMDFMKEVEEIKDLIKKQVLS